MKKSATVTLALLGASGLLAACSNSEPDIQTAVYQTVEQCIKETLSKVECEKSFTEAKVDAEKNTPVFQSQADCEDEFGAGQCGPKPAAPVVAGAPAPAAQSSSSSGFMPLMVGFMLGRASSPLPDNRGYSTPIYPQAVYRSRSADGFVNAGGGYVSNKVGKVTVSPRGDAASYSPAKFAATPKTTTTLARGGFGGRVSVSS